MTRTRRNKVWICRWRRGVEYGLLGALVVVLVLAHRHATRMVERCEEDEARELQVVAQAMLEPCPEFSEDLVGFVNLTVRAPSHDELDKAHPELLAGGHWRPLDCRPHSRVAIVVPYRDRDEELRAFLHHMHDFLQKQKLEYGIYAIEQSGDADFNAAILRNIGFVEANAAERYDCVVFHDVDVLPENDHNFYGCPPITEVHHLCIALSYNDYAPLFNGAVFGGAVTFTNEQFRKVNGYSNLYFGWGGEDDDLYARTQKAGYKIVWIPRLKGRYKGTKHPQPEKGALNAKLWGLKDSRMATDGLSSLDYDVTYRVERTTFTWIQVNVHEEKYKKAAEEFIKTMEEKDLNKQMIKKMKARQEEEEKQLAR